jgi:UDP-arabinose 4-epimerase
MAESRAVLVAGGAGYIGSHTAKLLQQAGYRPVVLDNLSTGNRFALRYGPFIEGSAGDSALVRRVVEQYRPIGAILFSAHIEVGESSVNPRKYFQNNVVQAIGFLDAALDSGLNNIVFSSTCAVYGPQAKMPLSEANPTAPASPYAETKLAVERVLHWYGKAYGLKSASLRYFNAAGADPSGEIGESHPGESHLIPLAIRAALGGKPLRVFGTDYPTPDGTAIRDYIHVLDLGEAHLRAMRHLADGGDSLILNLGTGQGHSVREVIQAVERAAGGPVPVEYAPRRAGDVPALVADASKAREILGWAPKYPELQTIVSTAWNWHKDHEPALVQA